MFAAPYSPSNEVIAVLCPIDFPQLRSAMVDVILGSRRGVPSLEIMSATAVMEYSLQNSEVKTKIGEIVKSYKPEAFTPLFFGNCRALRDLVLQNIEVDEQTCVIVYRDALFVLFRLEREHCLVNRYPENRFSFKLLEIFEVLFKYEQTTVTVCLVVGLVQRGIVSQRIDRIASSLGLIGTRQVPAEATRVFVTTLSSETRFFTRTFIRPHQSQRQ